MYYYITSDENKDAFDDLKEWDILNKDIKHKQSMTFDEIMKFIKKELRNITITCFIIDASIIVMNTNQSIENILDTFFILNPYSKAILLQENAEPVIGEYQNLLVVSDRSNIKRVSDRFLNGDASENKEVAAYDIVTSQEQVSPIKIEEVEPVDTVPSEPVKESASDRKPAKERKIRKAEGMKSMPVYNQDPDTLHNPDEIYKKAAAPCKISEGMSLKKRVEQSRKQEKSGDEDSGVAVSDNDVPDIVNDVVKRDQDIWTCNNIVIGMVGTERRVGTTWAAILLANYLSSRGAKVTYSEANSHNHLESLSREFNFAKDGEGYRHSNTYFFMNSVFDIDAGMNFIILDLGSIAENDQLVTRIIQELVHHVVIVSGRRMYEQKNLLHYLSLLPDENTNILFSFTAQEEGTSLAEKYKELAEIISYIPYETNLNNVGEWSKDIRKLFEQYNEIKK